MVGLKNTVTYAKISPKTLNPGDIAGNVQQEEVYETCAGPIQYDLIHVSPIPLREIQHSKM